MGVLSLANAFPDGKTLEISVHSINRAILFIVQDVFDILRAQLNPGNEGMQSLS